MRAGYGKKLRAFVAKKRIEILIDFGDLPVFEEATTYPNIVHLNNSAVGQVFKACNVQTLDFPQGLNAYLNENLLEIDKSDLTPEGWALTNSEVQRLLSKLKNTGQPLSDYVGGKIYRGVLTGLNEAFVIDVQTKEQLIERDPKSAEIIKPFLTGRDIKRYQTPRADKYLIFTRRGVAIEEYPAILDYLCQFRSRLEPKPKNHKGEWAGRKEGTYKWYEIQDAVDYYDQFEKPKILWPGISSDITSFALDVNGYFGNDNNQMIVSDNLYLLGILNSKVSRFILSGICDYVQGGYARLKINYVRQLPIAQSSSSILSLIEKLVFEVIQQKKRFKDTVDLENQIDQLVYQLYKLSEEEIKIVEGV